MKSRAPKPQMQYLSALDEEATMAAVAAGASIGRFGDGELSIMRGGNCVSQVHHRMLAAQLRQVLTGEHEAKGKDFLIGIPRLDPRSPKLSNWTKLAPRFVDLMGDRAPAAVYGSAFISRPDSAPWIDTEAFYNQVQSLWLGQEVCLVANGQRSLTAPFLLENGAARVEWVECSYRDSYQDLDRLLGAVKETGLHRVLLCCGPTATVLANKLCAAGHHAVDLGHMGMFWRRYLDPHHPIIKHVEQREINRETGKVEPNP